MASEFRWKNFHRRAGRGKRANPDRQPGRRRRADPDGRLTLSLVGEFCDLLGEVFVLLLKTLALLVADEADGLDFGARKTFFNKKLTLSVNCRDVLDSWKFRNYTSSDTFKRHQLFRRGNRKVAVTLSWNFGNMKQKPSKRRNDNAQMGEEMQNS